MPRKYTDEQLKEIRLANLAKPRTGKSGQVRKIRAIAEKEGFTRLSKKAVEYLVKVEQEYIQGIISTVRKAYPDAKMLKEEYVKFAHSLYQPEFNKVYNSVQKVPVAKEPKAPRAPKAPKASGRGRKRKMARRDSD